MASSAALKFSAPALVDPDEAVWELEDEEAAVANLASHTARRLEALHNGLRIGQPNGSPTDLTALRSQVASVVAGNHSAGPAWPTGVRELDAALGGGVPRGRVTEVVGPMGAGKTSLVRQLVARVLNEGAWVAWVDATRTLAPQELAGLGERLIVVRPGDHTRGAWCTDLLLRSGVFALVVLDGAPVLSRTVGVRLSQLARERDAAFVVLRDGTQGSRLGGAVRLQVRPQAVAYAHSQTQSQSQSHPQSQSQSQSQSHSPRQFQSRVAQSSEQSNAQWLQRRRLPDTTRSVGVNALANGNGNTQQRNYSVLVEKGGSYRTVEVTCAIVVARRVCANTEIPDRRGVAKRTRVVAGAEPQHAEQQTAAHEPVRAECGGEHAAERVQQHIQPPAEPAIAAARQHATGASAARRPDNEAFWKGRGRARIAESNYGRFTRRGEARRLLHTREQRSAEQEQQRQSRQESRRQSRRALHQYATSLG